VHGCFWHGHRYCSDFRLPATRRAWWTAKIAGNCNRDLRVQRELQLLGWDVVTIWACALKTRAARAWLLKRLPALLPPAKTPPGKGGKTPPPSGPGRQ
jgi:DNA mismatch endonuclease (patch repair protein)